jgi:hypothetical protein
MRAKITKTTVVAIVASVAILGAGCGSTPNHGGSARIVGPSVAQIQAYLNEKLNPHQKPCNAPTAALPRGATELERAVAKSKEFGCYDIPHIDSQTTCIDEGASRFKCLTTYSGGQQDNELTNATCTRHTPLSCISETTKTEGEG